MILINFKIEKILQNKYTVFNGILAAFALKIFKFVILLNYANLGQSLISYF